MSLTSIKVNNSSIVEVDDKPIIGSSNLVESRGIFNEFEQINGNIIDGRYINSSGEEVLDDDWCIAKVFVNGGDAVLYTSGYSVTPPTMYLTEYNENNVRVDDWRAGGQSPRSFSLKANTKYVKASFSKNNTYPWILNIDGVDKIIVGKINTLDNKINTNTQQININTNAIVTQGKEIINAFNEINSIAGVDIISDKAVYNSGEIVDDSGYLITSKIYVNSGDELKYLGGFSGYVPQYGLGAYNIDSEMIYVGFATTSERIITAPVGTSYIIATFYKNSNYYLKVNNVLVMFNMGDIQLIDKNIDYLLGNLIVNSTLKESGLIEYYKGLLVTTKISAKSGDVVKYLGGFSGSGGIANLVAYDKNDSKLSSWISTGYERELTMPANTYYIRATFSKDNNHYLKINDVDAIYEGIVQELDRKIQRKVVFVNINNQVLSGGYNGNVWLSLGIKLKAGLKYNIRLSLNKPSTADVFFVSNLYACNASSGGSSRVEDITSLFGVTKLEYGNTYIAEYTPSTNDIGWFNYSFNSNEYSYDYTTSLLIEAEVDNYAKSEEVGDLSNLHTNDKSNLVAAINESFEKINSTMPINVFGDILPPLFKNKLMALENDLLIACPGDSLTGLIERCDAQEEPEHSPAGCQYKGWIFLLQERVSKIKPTYDRLDSKRNDVDVFIKNGTWQDVISAGRTEIYDSDGTSYGQERSLSALTFFSADTNASISFKFDADNYEKCNIVFSKEPDAVLTNIIISEGNGKLLASIDRTTWVEANGFQVAQRTFDANGNDYTSYANLNGFTNACASNGIATRERHRRIWMKKVEGVTGEINISYQRDNTTSYSNSYMYCWGIEKYKGNAIFFDNLGRGGRSTNYLKGLLTDVFDRHPDLVIYEMPLANEVSHSGSGVTREVLKGSGYYGQYFLELNEGGGDSFKYRSNDYTTMPIIVLFPHGRSTYFDDNNNAVILSTQPNGEPDAYTCCKQIYGWLMAQLKNYENVKFINLYDQLINEALANSSLINKGFYGSTMQITADTVHLSQYGAKLWMKYLAAIFQI